MMQFQQEYSFQQNWSHQQHNESVETNFNGFHIEEEPQPETNGPAMKIKEVEITANVAWSPKDQYPILLAAGTAAQQLDASFDTTSKLEVYSVNLNENGHDMPKLASLPQEQRFHSLVWAPKVLVGGMERGFVQVYDVSKLLKNENPLIFSKDKHTGSVNSLDLNPFQNNLLASGASDSEIFIWDLNKLSMPMTPGAKSQPLEEVKSVAWNRQVQHILASTASSKCVVFDLRKNEPIIKVSSDATSGARMKYKPVAWHPEVATQLCLASEDDYSPVIQIWDLRLASSPLKTLAAHSKGILSLAWCNQDSDLMMSCGRDNRIITWNPNSNVENGEVLCEILHSSQWTFNVSWCPRNPAMIAASSFDSRVSIYSLMGGQQQQVQPTTSNIADSFPGMENMVPVTPAPSAKTQTVQLKQPPKWMKRPCGANFAFGGKLVSFDKDSKAVKVGHVVTEESLVKRSMKLETTLQTGNFNEFCQAKIDEDNTEDRQVWQFIKANFEQDPRIALLSLLQYEPNDIREKICLKTGTKPANAVQQDDFVSDRIDAVTDDFGALNANDDDAFENIAKESESRAKLLEPFDICIEENGSGFLSKALLTGNIELAVELCLEQNRMADAIILALQGDPSLVKKVQDKYFEKNGSKELPLIRAVVNNDWNHVIHCVAIDKNWKEALVAALTYAEHDQVGQLCTALGNRLLEANLKNEALLCFICARNLDQVVSCWMDTRTSKNDDNDPNALQDLVEVVMTLKSAAERLSGGQSFEISTGSLSLQLTKYANILAAQGALSAALTYLGQSNEESINLLRERLQGALGHQACQQNQRKTSSQSQRYQRMSSSSGTTGIHNPAAEAAFQPPPVPHLDQGGITNRRGSRPPPDHFNDPYGAANSSRMTSGYGLPSQPVSQPHFVPNYSQDWNQPPQAQPNIFTPDFSAQSNIGPPPVAPPAAVPPPPPSSDGYPRDRLESTSSNRSFGIDHGPPVSSGPGWNDPPAAALALAKSRMAAKTTTVGAITAPITQPLLGADPAMDQHGPPLGPPATAVAPPPMNYGYYGGSTATSTFEPAPMAAAPPPANLFQPPPQQPQNYGYAGFQPQQQAEPAPPVAPAVVEPPKPVAKGPIPSEHQILQDVFDGLKNKCAAASNHPQIKRKLTDVGKKLELLYDKLREEALPPNVTTGLHQMVQYIWAYDYNSCLQVINQMVSGGSFTLLADFLPGVKVLIQVAGQLNVYVERPQ